MPSNFDQRQVRPNSDENIRVHRGSNDMVEHGPQNALNIKMGTHKNLMRSARI